jgi:hypothetical protein
MKERKQAAAHLVDELAAQVESAQASTPHGELRLKHVVFHQMPMLLFDACSM